MNEQRTIPKLDVGNSDIVTQLKSVFFVWVCFIFFTVKIHEKIVLSISVVKVLISFDIIIKVLKFLIAGVMS